MPAILRLLLVVCLMVPAMPGAAAHAHAEAAGNAVAAVDSGDPPCHDDAPASGLDAADAAPAQGHDCCTPDGTSANHGCGCDYGCGGPASTGLPAQAASGSVQARTRAADADPTGSRARVHSAPPVRPPIG